MTKLSQEDVENMTDILDSPIWAAVLKVCRISVENHEAQVLSCNINTDDRELFLRKARLEGAQSVERSLRAISAPRKEK